MSTQQLVLRIYLHACPWWSAAYAAPRPAREAPAACSLLGAWSYVAPEMFEGLVWNSESDCLYHFEVDAADPAGLRFESPAACFAEGGGHHSGTRPGREIPGQLGNVTGRVSAGGRRVDLTFRAHNGSAPARTVARRGWVTPDCSFIDMSDGGWYVKGAHPMDMAPHEWLRVAAAWVMRAAMLTFEDGTRHLTPGVPMPVKTPTLNDGYYIGQWMRDSYYGIANGWGLVNETARQSFVASADWMFSHARPDGVLPASCPPRGPCIYGSGWSGGGGLCADQPGQPDWEGCQALDSGAFGVKLAAHLWAHAEPAAAAALYRKWVPRLLRGLAATTKDPDGSGLVWSNTSRPMVGYGFQDGEVKSGDVLYANLLYWNATRLLAQQAAALGDGAVARQMTAEAARVRRLTNVRLWNASAGVFMASTGMECGNFDVWGNALAAASGFATAAQRAAIFEFFRAREAEIFYEGQVREVPAPSRWSDAPCAQPGRPDPRVHPGVRQYQ